MSSNEPFRSRRLWKLTEGIFLAVLFLDDVQIGIFAFGIVDISASALDFWT